jgi:hypothetical protein
MLERTLGCHRPGAFCSRPRWERRASNRSRAPIAWDCWAASHFVLKACEDCRDLRLRLCCLVRHYEILGAIGDARFPSRADACRWGLCLVNTQRKRVNRPVVAARKLLRAVQALWRSRLPRSQPAYCCPLSSPIWPSRTSTGTFSWEGLRTSDFVWLMPALGVLALSLWVRAVRWQLLFQPETRPPIGPTTRATIVGQFFNNILPARAGEAARIVMLKQEAGTSRTESLGTAVAERISDLLALLVLRSCSPSCRGSSSVSRSG